MELWVLNVEEGSMYVFSSRKKGMEALEKVIDEVCEYDNIDDFECIVEKERLVYYYSPTAGGVALQRAILDEE